MKILTIIYSFLLVLFSVLINIRVVATAAPTFVVVLSLAITLMAIAILCLALYQYFQQHRYRYDDNDDYDDDNDCDEDDDYEGNDCIDYVIIQYDGKPTTFSDGSIVVYGDCSEASDDLMTDDLGLLEIVYLAVNDKMSANLFFKNCHIGSFTYIEQEMDSDFQKKLNDFLALYSFIK